MRDTDECKSIVASAARHCGVSALHVATRLMSTEDKDDLRKCLIDKQDLINAIIVWRDNGMPDYTHGRFVPLKWDK